MQADRPGIAPLRKILIDRPTAAELLSVSVRTIARMTASGELPSVQIDSRRLYALSALRRWARNK